ncbi:MAG: hypothetical protein V3U80_03930 [Flavobacteriaceae bacterium]
MKKIVLIGLLFLQMQLIFSQQAHIIENDDPVVKSDLNSRKGQFFASWGWNRSSYTASDIHFSGNGYDFTLYDVKSQDKPNPFGIKFFSPADLTLPATNAKVGYFFKDNYNVILGYDHMKYVIYQYVDVKIDGEINIGNPTYDGVYNDDTINLAYDFLRFEHTDGLNYIFAAVNRFDNFNELLGIQTDKFQVNLEEGIDIGFLYPKTNTRLLGKERHDDFHVSGFGLSAKAGLNLTFYKHFYLQADMKYGYINMPKIRTTNDKVDNAKQHFGFFEAIYSFGWRFKI